jgi:toxin FitB
VTTATGSELSDLLVIDSSGWLEYITADTKVDLVAPFFKDSSKILVPALVLFEVRRVLILRNTKALADNFVSDALLLKIIAIDEKIALSAAAVSTQFRLSLADALIYQCAIEHRATLVTSDTHFQNLPGVHLF